MEVYSNMGIRRAGIVDVDILRVEDEWHRALTALSFSDTERSQATTIRNEIAKFMKQQPAAQRIQAAADKLAEVTGSLREHNSTQFSSAEEAQRANETFLKSLEQRLQEAAHVTGP
jgi:hypothetical protein